MYLRQFKETLPSLLLRPRRSFQPTGSSLPKSPASTIFRFFLRLPHCPSNPLKNPSSSSSVSKPSVLLLSSAPNRSSLSASAATSTTAPLWFITSYSFLYTTIAAAGALLALSLLIAGGGLDGNASPEVRVRFRGFCCC